MRSISLTVRVTLGRGICQALLTDAAYELSVKIRSKTLADFRLAPIINALRTKNSMISGDSVQILTYLVYTAAGLGTGVVTGLAGLSAAVVITPMLVSLCGWESYDAVTVALASDVLASMLSAYTYYKNKNIDLRRGGLVTVTAFLGTIAGSYCGFLFSRHSPDGLGYISMLTTVFLGVKFLVKPITGGTDASAAAEQSGRKAGPADAARLRHRLGVRLYPAAAVGS